METPFSISNGRQPQYSVMKPTSQYVSMRDGTRLAVDVYLPKGSSGRIRLPAILLQSRYWRAIEARPPLSWFVDDLEKFVPVLGTLKPYFIRRGYAIVDVDVRGTGASFGVWRYPWEPVSLLDACDLLDWITAQPWSNGRVAGMGVSYLGTTAELLLATGHPAVKAVVPMYNHPDPFVDLGFPGGLFNHRFVRDWSEMDIYLDRNLTPPLFTPLTRRLTRGVRPVDGDRVSLAQALEQHTDNGNSHQIAHDVTYRDEFQPEVGACMDDIAIHRYRQTIFQSQVPSYGWASWMDGGTAEAALRRFMTYPGADHVTIGGWNHAGLKQASPYLSPQAPLSPPIEVQWGEILRFLDAYLLDAVNDVRGERRINYYTLGAERWQSSSEWPPAGIEQHRWYLAAGGTLTRHAPEQDGLEDNYTVDFQATTGLKNRWWSLTTTSFGSIEYPGGARQGAALPSYETAPFEKDLEISGNPVLKLEVACSAPDCAFICYLEDVAPDGQIYYLTEGQLRAIHRQVDPAPPYVQLIPYHSFKKSAGQPLIPGETAEIIIGLQPISALLRAGHRLRLSLAGHDADTFARIPAEGEVHWKVQRNRIHASWLELPIKIS